MSQQLSVRPVWRSFVSHYIGIVACLGIAVAAGAVHQPSYEDPAPLFAIAGVAVFVAFFLALLVLYHRFANRYYIEGDRIEHRRGIIARDVDSVRLRDLRNINLRQSIVDRLLLMGHLQFSTAGGDGIEVRWRNVGRPAEVKARIEAMQ